MTTSPAVLTAIGISLMVAYCLRAHEPGSSLPEGGNFRIRREGQTWWYVAPDGRRVFSLGVCCVNMGSAEADYNPARPSYCAARHYSTKAAWVRATEERLRSWGFTTLGGWSDYASFIAEARGAMAMAPVLHAGSTAGIPWLDMWDPAVLARVDETARAAIENVRGARSLLGFYSDNELGWWNSVLVQTTLGMPPESGQRRRVVSYLRRHYGGCWSRLEKDFDPEGASSFEEFEHHGILYLRPGGNGARVHRRLLGLLARRYYEVTASAIRKCSGACLVLGDRYQSFYYPEVVLAARPYVDVISTNLTPHWIDGSFARYYLDTLHELCRKPVQVGEFYMCATENRSGNRNSSSGFPVVANQRERARGFARTLSELALRPYVVGADWFQYYDEPPHGREDGEDYNMGLVDIHDVPYDEMVEAALNLNLERVHADARNAPSVPHAIPRADGDPLEDFRYLRAMLRWDRDAGFIPPSTRAPVADLYATWTPEALYLGIHSMGFIEDAAYRSGSVPECDRAMLRLRVGRPLRIVEVRYGAGRPPTSSDSEVQVIAAKGTEGGVFNALALVVPAHVLGVQKLRAGTAVTLDVTLDTAGRCDHVRWHRRLDLGTPSS